MLSVDYRLVPENPHPSASDDCLGAYKRLLAAGHDADKIILAGESAGGYHALLTLLRARDEHLPLPAGVVALSPGTDLALTGESYRSNAATDPVLADLGFFWWIESFLGGSDPLDPAVSPLYADLRYLPPILLQASTTEMLLDDSRMFFDRARASGVDIEIQTWNETLHAFHYYDLPETTEAVAGIAAFVRRVSP